MDAATEVNGITHKKGLALTAEIAHGDHVVLAATCIVCRLRAQIRVVGTWCRVKQRLLRCGVTPSRRCRTARGTLEDRAFWDSPAAPTAESRSPSRVDGPASDRHADRQIRCAYTASCGALISTRVVRRTIAAWLGVRLRYRDIAQQAAQQPALCTAGGTGLTGRTRRSPPTRRSTSRGAVGAARAAGAGPAAAERGRAGRRAARP